MPVAPARSRPAPRSRTSRVGAIAFALVSLAVALGVLLYASGLLADPERTGVVIENPTGYSMNVHVQPAEGGPRLALGPVDAHSTRELRDIVDQGDRWLFRFSHAGISAATVEATPDAAGDVAVTIPASAERVLREAGFAPRS